MDHPTPYIQDDLPEDVHGHGEEPPDAFARMVAVLRHLTGYDPGAEDEAHDEVAADRTRRWAGRVVLVAAALLLVLNASSLRSWALTLEPSWGAETLRRLTEVWSERTAAAGLDGPRRAVRDAYRGLRETDHGQTSQPPGA